MNLLCQCFRAAPSRRLCGPVGAALALGLLAGCAQVRGPSPNDPYYAPVATPTPRAQPASNGSLYSDGALQLFTDNKARRVGDILTVILSESTSTQKSSGIGVSKESDISIPEVAGAAGTLLGRGITAGAYSLGTDLGASRDFSGAADANQRNNLQGSIAVTVVEVWPNGTLSIRGEKWMTLNRGDEFIRVSGLVRPDDIAPDNSLVSTKIANARITYAGTGALADSQTMGWLSRFFNSSYWPF